MQQAKQLVTPLYKKACALFDKRQYLQAIPILNRLIDLAQAPLNSYQMLAQAHLALNQFPAARKACMVQLQAIPTYGLTLETANKIRAHAWNVVGITYEQKSVIAAKHSYKKSMQLDSNNAQARHNLVRLELQQLPAMAPNEKLKTCISLKALMHPIIAHSQNPHHTNTYANILQRLAHYQQAPQHALQSLQQAVFQYQRTQALLKTKPSEILSHTMVQDHLTYCYNFALRLGHLCFAEAVQASPPLASRLEDAKDCYNFVAQQAPDNRLAWLQLGVIAYKQANYTMAVQHFKTTIKIEPLHPDVAGWVNYAEALSKLGYYQKALHACECATIISPQDTEAGQLARQILIQQAIAGFKQAHQVAMQQEKNLTNRGIDNNLRSYQAQGNRSRPG